MICGNKERDNYEEVFSPEADMAIIRLLIAVSFHRGRTSCHLEFTNAFRNEILDGA